MTRFSSPRGLLGTFAIVLILLLSSFGTAATVTTARSGSGVLAVPGHGGPVAALTGAQLQNSPYVQAGTTPLVNHPLDKILSYPAPSTGTSFTVGFQLRNADALQNLISAQSTPGSPMFQHYLTQAQEQKMFGPDQTTVQNTINYFQSLGFTLNSRGAISLSFTGSVGSANQAFRTSLANVNAGVAQPQLLNSLPLSLPAPIAGSIASINGFEGFAQFHPTSIVNPQAIAAGLTTANPAMAPVHPGVDTLRTNETEAYNMTNHAFYWFNYFSHAANVERWWQTITPASLNSMYNATQLLNLGYNGNSTPGKRITIALVMAGGINPGDLEAYGQMVWNNPHQLINRVTPLTVDRTFGLNGTQTYLDGASGEMALDIEYSGTMSPGARIMPVYGPCLCTNVLDDDYAALDALSTLPSIISNSWGGEEDGAGSLSGPNWQNDLTMHNYFGLLTVRGATILASSADGGGFDTGNGVLSGSFPATDPYVLSIDGVRTAAAASNGWVFPNPSNFGLANISIAPTRPNYPVHVNTADHMAYQSFWYQPFSNTTLYSAAPEASGGFGTSSWFNQTWFEHGIGVPDVGRSLGSGVAAEADFNESIFFAGTFELFYGGTSFACPTVAGMFGDIIDYLQAHGHSIYLGDGNVPVFWVGNAWKNGNLTLNPYYDVNNGTSFWGNHGVINGWQWPQGQKFPRDSHGSVNYGNTTPGWDFPTGWGVPNVINFAIDLNYLESLPSAVTTTNAAGTAFDTGTWANLATNQSSYAFHVNASSAIAASGPVLSVEFFPEAGQEVILHPVMSATLLPAPGFSFSLSTTASPLNQPGLLIFTLGNSTTKTLAFEYDWISWAIPSGGVLAIHVVSPGTGQITGGSATFGAGAGFFFPPIVADPEGFAGANLLVVQVTYNGVGVYNARVSGIVASAYDLTFEGSRALNASQSYGNGFTPITNTVSTSFTNLTGYAYVWTWNVIKPTTLYVNATYGTATASTSTTMIPPPNIRTSDAYGGKFSGFNWIKWILYATRQPDTPTLESLWAPNSINQSGLYTFMYAWQGEQLPVTINDYQGNAVPGIKVWYGTYDLGSFNKFYNYKASNGIVGYVNDTKSVGVTNPSGVTTIEIPQNMSIDMGNPIFGGNVGTFDGPAGIGAIAASIPGESNLTVQIAQPCPPPSASTSNVLLTCIYNDSVRRNYTSTPVLVLPDPVNAWTQTPSAVHRDFFGSGNGISFGLSVNLPTQDPWVSGFGYNWRPDEMHVTSVKAFVDGNYAGQADPAPNNLYQSYSASNNLTGNYGNGTHELTVYVTSSSGQNFSFSHRFIVGSVEITNLFINNTYTILPYNINWTVHIPTAQINNHTFSQSMQIQYVTGGCSGQRNPCPTVVNLTEKIHDNVPFYNQSINLTMLNLRHFYSGAGFLPSGQYLITVWLNANHSGNITAQLPTYFVFSDLNGSFTGPTDHQQVPLGNVTISFVYAGGYLQNATLSVFAAGEPAAPVFTTGIFVPAVGSAPRGGAVNWQATVVGAYQLVMDLGTPYTHLNVTEWINVTTSAPVTYLNKTQSPALLGGMTAAQVGTVLAIVGGILGFLVGLFVAPAFRGAPSSAAAPKGPKAWEELGGSSATAKSECPVCHEQFPTDYALHMHQKSAHGIEE